MIIWSCSIEYEGSKYILSKLVYYILIMDWLYYKQGQKKQEQ